MKKRIVFALLLMGFTSLVVQTLLIREFLISFYGNELIIGIILTNWIILEALGSSLSSGLSQKARRPFLIYAFLQLGISIYLPLSVFLIRNIKNLLGLTLGEGVGILAVFLSSFFILAPLSLFDGAQFPFGCRIFAQFSKKPQESAGRVYILEAIGFIFAGPIFTYLLITQLNSFQIALILGLLNLSSGILLLRDELIRGILRKVFSGIITLFLISNIFIFFGFSKELQNFSINKQFGLGKVLDYRNSLYANLVVSRAEGQYTFYSDGIPIITTPIPDITCIEELAHFTLLAHPNPKTVLVLSGGAGGLLGEILKYPLEKLDYTELDPLLIKLLKKYPTELTQKELTDPRLNIKHLDGRRFVRITLDKYDVVLLNLPLPSTLQLNRFYTQEFFASVRAILKPEGIFTLILPGSLSYISQELRSLNGSILNTLKEIFSYVKVIPGDTNLYLSSNKDFSISPEIFIARLKERKISTRLLSPFHLEYRLHQRWQEWLKDSLGDISEVRKNFNLKPSAVFYSLSYWNALFSPAIQKFFKFLDRLNFALLFFILCGLGLALLVWQRFSTQRKNLSVGFAIATTGFIGMSFDLIIIFAYQCFFGFVFSHLALLVTAFMTGLTFGGYLMTKRIFRIKKEIFSFLKIELSIVLFCLAVGPLFIYLNRFPRLNFAFIFFFLACLSGFLVGSEFPLANKIWQGETGYTQTAGTLYALDLAGAWLAALIVSVALVPVIGILKTCILLAGLKIISLILITTCQH